MAYLSTFPAGTIGVDQSTELYKYFSEFSGNTLRYFSHSKIDLKTSLNEVSISVFHFCIVWSCSLCLTATPIHFWLLCKILIIPKIGTNSTQVKHSVYSRTMGSYNFLLQNKWWSVCIKCPYVFLFLASKLTYTRRFTIYYTL